MNRSRVILLNAAIGSILAEKLRQGGFDTVEVAEPSPEIAPMKLNGAFLKHDTRNDDKKHWKNAKRYNKGRR